MSRTFIKEWVEKVDENNSITYRLKNGQEKIITSVREEQVPFMEFPHNIKRCYKYSIVDNQGKKFTIYVDMDNEEKIYYKEMESDISIIKIEYVYNEYNKLDSKTIRSVVKREGLNFDSGTKSEKYQYFNQDIISHESWKYSDYSQDLKLINEFKTDSNGTVIAELIPSNRDYFRCTVKSEYDYILLYNNNIINTKIYDEKLYKENNVLLTEFIEFTIDKFTYKIINYNDKSKLKLIVKTNSINELTLSERFFYDTENKNIDYFSLFAAIALREKTLLGIKDDDPEKYFFILLMDLEELVKFNFIKKEDKKEEETKKYEM